MVCGNSAFQYDWALTCDRLNQPQAMDLQQDSLKHQSPLSAKPGLSGPALIDPSTDRKDVSAPRADPHRQRSPAPLGQRKGSSHRPRPACQSLGLDAAFIGTQSPASFSIT